MHPNNFGRPRLVALLIALIASVTLARADEMSAATRLEAEIARMKLLAEAKAEITKALKSPSYESASRRRDAQLRALMEADMRRIRSTHDWATTSKAQRRNAVESVRQLALARLDYDDAERHRLLDSLCRTPKQVNDPNSRCYKTLYSPNLILPD